MNSRFDGKVVIITGAAGGLGRVYAKSFAERGARLVLNDAGTDVEGRGTDPTRIAELEAELRGAGHEVTSDASDVSTEAGVETLFTLALQRFGTVDVLVTSAGLVRDRPFLKMSLEEFDAVSQSLLRSTFLTTQAFAKAAIREKKSARIVHSLAMSAFTGSLAQANYSAANAGVFGLMRTASIELQKHRISVNGVAPLAKTRMTESLPMFENIKTLTPEHVVPAVLYLASDLIGERTGHVLGVAGARIFSLRLVESNGRFKEDAEGVWAPEEIREQWDGIVRS